jgi:hypothetical protein
VAGARPPDRIDKHWGLKRLYEKGDRSGIRPDLVGTIERILWSVTVRANWSVVFRFEDGDAADVELIDYH